MPETSLQKVYPPGDATKTKWRNLVAKFVTNLTECDIPDPGIFHYANSMDRILDLSSLFPREHCTKEVVIHVPN